MDALTVHTNTPWAPAVTRVTVAALPEDKVLISDPKPPGGQLNNDVTEGLRTKVLSHHEVARTEHGLAAVPDTASTAAVSLWTVAVSLETMQTITDNGKGPHKTAESSMEDLLARGSGVVMKSEIESEQRVQVLEQV